MQPIVSANHGAGNKERVRTFLKFSLCFTMVLGVVFTVLCKYMPYTIAGILVKDSELIKSTGEAIGIYGWAYLFMGINILADAYFYSVEKARYAIMVSLSRGLVAVVITLMIMVKLLGLNGVWITVAEFATLLLSSMLFYRYKRCEAMHSGHMLIKQH